MEFVESLTESQLRELHAFYRQTWWSRDRTLEDTRQVVNGSQLIQAAVDEQQSLAGLVRVITDFTFKALILDVIVREDCRGTRLGSRLVQGLKDHPALRRVRHLELYCMPELTGFYERLGFSQEVGGVRLMRCVR